MAFVTTGSFDLDSRINVLLIPLCLGLIACEQVRKPSLEVARVGTSKSDNGIAKAVGSTSSCMIATARTTVASLVEFSRTSTCLDFVDSKLEYLRWLEVVSQRCLPGSRRHASVAVQTVVRDHPAEIQMPAEVRGNCWIALVVAPYLNTPLVVKLLDVESTPLPIETISDARGIVPSRGAFCSLQERFRGLQFQTDSPQKFVINVAWYSAPASPP